MSGVGLRGWLGETVSGHVRSLNPLFSSLHPLDSSFELHLQLINSLYSYFEPSLDALSLRSDVISSIKILSLQLIYSSLVGRDQPESCK